MNRTSNNDRKEKRIRAEKALRAILILKFIGVVVIVWYFINNKSRNGTLCFNDFLHLIASGLIIALVANVVGGLFGFIFAIPHISTKNQNDKNSKGYYEPSNSLDRIADRATTIILGLGLTQVLKVPHYLDVLKKYLSTLLSGNEASGIFGVGIFIFYLISGFIAIYLWGILNLEILLTLTRKQVDDYNKPPKELEEYNAELDELIRTTDCPAIKKYLAELADSKPESEYVFQDWFNKGRSEFALKDFAKCAASMENALEIKPKDLDAHLYRGRSYQKLNSNEKAVEIFNETINLAPDSAEAFNNRGMSKLGLGTVEEAIKDYDKAIKINTTYLDAYINRGVANLFLGNKTGIGDKKHYYFNTAIEDFKNALILNPDENKRTQIYNYLAYIYFRLVDYDNVIIYCNKAIELDPNSGIAYYNRGHVKDNKNDNEGAIADYSMAIEKKPDLTKAYNNRGYIKLKQGKNKEALADFNKAIEVDANYALAYDSRGELRYSMKQYTEALEDLNNAIRLDVSLDDAYYFRGLTLIALDKKEEGLKDLNKALEILNKTLSLSPHDLESIYLHGRTLIAIGRNDEGCKDLKEAKRLGHKDADRAMKENGCKED